MWDADGIKVDENITLYQRRYVCGMFGGDYRRLYCAVGRVAVSDELDVIRTACIEAAYAALSDVDKAEINRVSLLLCEKCNGHRLGEKGAHEVLFSLGVWLNAKNAQIQERQDRLGLR